MSLGKNLAGAAAALAMVAPFAFAPPGPINSDLIVHEWGTFTSVADPDGNPVDWASLETAPDLPCFVDHLATRGLKRSTLGLVRMETPVIYFYSPRAVTLSVRVQFSHGLITEWYPQASAADSPGFDHIAWNSVQLSPKQNLEFPSSQGQSRYFAARNTDSTPLQIDGQQEKFIFYRGVGSFSIPLRPRFISDGKLEVRNAYPGSIPLAILFENRNGKIGFRIATGIRDSVELNTPDLTGNLTNLRQSIANSLIEFGLYKKEANAMLATWQDSWFEEGMRVFYIVPRERIDSALPLDIRPEPEVFGRVFMGRVEILAPWMRQRMLTAVNAEDTATLAKFGRFLDPFLSELQVDRGRLQLANERPTDSCIR